MLCLPKPSEARPFTQWLRGPARVLQPPLTQRHRSPQAGYGRCSSRQQLNMFLSDREEGAFGESDVCTRSFLADMPIKVHHENVLRDLPTLIENTRRSRSVSSVSACAYSNFCSIFQVGRSRVGARNRSLPQPPHPLSDQRVIGRIGQPYQPFAVKVCPLPCQPAPLLDEIFGLAGRDDQAGAGGFQCHHETITASPSVVQDDDNLPLSLVFTCSNSQISTHCATNLPTVSLILGRFQCLRLPISNHQFLLAPKLHISARAIWIEEIVLLPFACISPIGSNRPASSLQAGGLGGTNKGQSCR